MDHAVDPAGRRGPRFIDGVSNYCDRWCERCRVQTRCRAFHDHVRLEAAIACGLRDEALARVYDDSDEDGPPFPPLSASEQLEWERFLAEANRPPTPEEQRELDRLEASRDARVSADPLTLKTREYDELAHGVTAAARVALERREDPVVQAALEILCRFTFVLSVKTRRALRGSSEALEEADEAADFSASDADGTAKLIRLIANESRGAWEVLRQAGLADGVPGQMIVRLSEIDVLIASRFPGAMSFRRPGLDDPVD